MVSSQIPSDYIVPYMASSAWYAAWLRAFLTGGNNRLAIAEANVSLGIHGKDFSRCVVQGNNGPVLLSVAVEGGASALKRREAPSTAILSLHGNWPHVHLGALEACYGRTPYYRHLIPILAPLYDCGRLSLKDFCNSFHRPLMGFMGIDIDSGDFMDWSHAAFDSPAVTGRGHEIASVISARLSVVDALMKLGPETLPGLLFLSKNLS